MSEPRALSFDEVVAVLEERFVGRRVSAVVADGAGEVNVRALVAGVVHLARVEADTGVDVVLVDVGIDGQLVIARSDLAHAELRPGGEVELSVGQVVVNIAYDTEERG